MDTILIQIFDCFHRTYWSGQPHRDYVVYAACSDASLITYLDDAIPIWTVPIQSPGSPHPLILLISLYVLCQIHEWNVQSSSKSVKGTCTTFSHLTLKGKLWFFSGCGQARSCISHKPYVKERGGLYMNQLGVLSTNKEIHMTVVFVEGSIDRIHMLQRNSKFTCHDKGGQLVDIREGEEEIGITSQ